MALSTASLDGSTRGFEYPDPRRQQAPLSTAAVTAVVAAATVAPAEGPAAAAAASATVIADVDHGSFNCDVSKRRRHQLFALALGLLEVGFSLYNAIVEEAFLIEDGTDFVFASSALMESIGLAVMLFVALISLYIATSEETSEERRDHGGWAGESWEKFGSPLPILVSGIHQKDPSLVNAGQVGALFQAIVVCVVGLVLLQRADNTVFLVLICVIPTLLCCGWCAVVWNAQGGCIDCFSHVEAPYPYPGDTDPSTQPSNHDTTVDTPRVVGDLFMGVACILLLLPLGIDIAEVVLLILLEGVSWRAMILAILDILVTSFVLLPWGVSRFKSSVLQATGAVRNAFSSFVDVSCDLCQGCWRHLLMNP